MKEEESRQRVCENSGNLGNKDTQEEESKWRRWWAPLQAPWVRGPWASRRCVQDVRETWVGVIGAEQSFKSEDG